MSFLPRPLLLERPNYEPTSQQEQFIVPLLCREIERAIATYATPAPVGGRALDVGCGRQPFRKALESIGYAYTSLDVQKNPEGTVDIVCAVDEPLPKEVTAHQPFQFLLCTEVMEHVANWDAAFRNMATLMARGGRLLVT